MIYTTENEFEHLDFTETYVKDIEQGNDYFHIWLDNVKILPENSCNRDIRKMRTNNLMFTIHDAGIVSLIREGMKVYDADGNPKSDLPEEVIPAEEYGEILPLFLEGCALEITKEQRGERFLYTFAVDASDESTYDLCIEGSGDSQHWDKFLSLDA